MTGDGAERRDRTGWLRSEPSVASEPSERLAVNCSRTVIGTTNAVFYEAGGHPNLFAARL
jgi:hypothetical protein